MKKQQLLDEVFALGNNRSVWDMKEAQMKIAEHHESARGKDPQLSDMFVIIDAFVVENERGDTDETYAVTRPIFDRLRKEKDWDFYDVRIFVVALGFYMGGFERLNSDANTALEKLKEYFYKDEYPLIKLAVHMNATTCMLRLRHFEEEVRNHPDNLKRFEEHFLFHIDAALVICKEEGITPAMADAMIRKGAFFGDQALIDEAFDVLEKFGDKDLMCLLKRSLDRFRESEIYINEARELNAIIGQNINKFRTARGVSRHDLGMAIGVLPSQIDFIESGHKNISVHALHKAASFLGTSTNCLLEPE